tara:strand:- start:441 stop:668 length:228 start_codon:yes stop_codon:yes gene_type:complete
MSKDKNNSYRQRIKHRIQNGKYEEHKGLSICKINDFYPLMSGKIMYQVHSYFFSQLYGDVEEALSKFFEIRRKIK